MYISNLLYGRWRGSDVTGGGAGMLQVEEQGCYRWRSRDVTGGGAVMLQVEDLLDMYTLITYCT